MKYVLKMLVPFLMEQVVSLSTCLPACVFLNVKCGGGRVAVDRPHISHIPTLPTSDRHSTEELARNNLHICVIQEKKCFKIVQ